MTLDDGSPLTQETVRSVYLRGLRQLYQRKSGLKAVSEGYVVGKVSKLAKPDSTGYNFWERLLSYCSGNRFDYRRLIQAFFMHADTISNFMLFKHEDIFSKTVAQLYHTLRPTAEACKASLAAQKTRLALHIDKQFLLNGTEREQSAVLALQTTSAPYCPLFRYCMLHRMGEDAAPWVFAALGQYAPDKDNYNSAWDDFIPEQLRVLTGKRNGAQQ